MKNIFQKLYANKTLADLPELIQVKQRERERGKQERERERQGGETLTGRYVNRQIQTETETRQTVIDNIKSKRIYKLLYVT